MQENQMSIDDITFNVLQLVWFLLTNRS